MDQEDITLEYANILANLYSKDFVNMNDNL